MVTRLSRCSQMVTRQAASVPRHGVCPICHTRFASRTVLSLATTRSGLHREDSVQVRASHGDKRVAPLRRRYAELAVDLRM